MNLTNPGFKSALTRSHPAAIAVFAALAAFCTYSCMYAFRKPFTVGTFEDMYVLGLKYKDVLVIAQLVGYTLSKFLGIKIVAEMKLRNRGFNVLILIAIAAVSLLLFGVTPYPYNIIFMFLNGIPLGMVWGIVFSFVEGRRATEFMGSVMAVSFIFSSGFVKSVGQVLLNHGVSEFWMPLFTGLIFIVPMVLFVFLLEQIPEPTPEDIAHRSERKPMTSEERRSLIKAYLPGIMMLVFAYVMLTIIRDFRDNFAANIWDEQGYGKQPSVFTTTEIIVSLVILAFMSMLIAVKNNLLAFRLNHWIVALGFVIAGGSTLLFTEGMISTYWWMVLNGTGLYLGYVPFNVMFFERKIAAIRKPANVGFLIYIADSFGYLGSVGILLFKNFGTKDISYSDFFIQSLYAVTIIGLVFMALSLLYFNRKLKPTKS